MLKRTAEAEKVVAELNHWVTAQRGRGRVAASSLGVSPQQLTNWMRGYRRPSLDAYFAIRRFLWAQQDMWQKRERAHSMIGYAVKTGRVIKPKRCEGCQAEGKRLSAHHDSYDQPLEVRWLCAKCHNNYHANHTRITQLPPNCPFA